MPIEIRKFCLCGVKLERKAADEDQARGMLTMFRLEHSGEGHGPANEQEYRRAVSKIIGQNAQKAKTKPPRPILNAIEQAGGNGHAWVNLGVEYCSACLVVRSSSTGDCKGAALMIREPELVRVR
jgi:hypothetical protein